MGMVGVRVADGDYIGFGNTKGEPHVIGVGVHNYRSPRVSYQETGVPQPAYLHAPLSAGRIATQTLLANVNQPFFET